MESIYINIEKEVFAGNILDIGFENYGVVYNIAKKYNDDCEIEYLESREGKKSIQEGIYDNCILFFSLQNLYLKHQKRNLLREIHRYLKDNGILHIWDIDKGIGKSFVGNIKLSLPEQKNQEIYLKDMNILNDNSKKTISDLLYRENFDIISSVCSDNIYCIKCKKKRRKTNEGVIDSD